MLHQIMTYIDERGIPVPEPSPTIDQSIGEYIEGR